MRILKKLIAVLILLLLLPILLLIGLIVFVEDGSPVIFRQKRIGLNNSTFHIYKFRSMRRNTPEVATHLLKHPEKYLLRSGKFLRRFSLDELPNLINVIRGEMNFIGPRPALHNQIELNSIRKEKNIYSIKPGLTGLAQVKGGDKLSLKNKIYFEEEYLKTRSIILDLKILGKTFIQILFSDKS